MSVDGSLFDAIKYFLFVIVRQTKPLAPTLFFSSTFSLFMGEKIVWQRGGKKKS